MKPRVGPQLDGEQRAWPLGTVVQLVHKSAWPGKQVSTEAQLSFLPSGFPPWRGLPSPKAVFTEAPPMGWQCSAKLKPQLWDVFSPGRGMFSEQPVVYIPSVSQGGRCSALHRTTEPRMQFF